MLRYNSAASQQQRLEQFLEESFSVKGAQPFSFHYDGKWSRTFLDDWKFEKRSDGVAYTSPDGLVAAVEVRTFEDFPAVEWLLTFENTAETDSKLIEDVNALDILVEAGPFRTAGTQQYGAMDNILYYNGGSDCKADDFIPCQEILHHICVREEMTFGSNQGRPTSGSHGAFPYFNMQTYDQGVFFAIGWSGQWKMRMKTRNHEMPTVKKDSAFTGGMPDHIESFQFIGGMPGISTILYPGEKIRTARILLIPWKGTVEDSFNVSRRFLLKYHTPHVDGKPAVLPLSLGSWGHFAWKNKEEIDLAVRSGLPLDTMWIDAGWYGPAGTQCHNPLHNDWSDHVGWYSHDPSRYPNGLGEVGQYAHENKMRFLLWLEPDRANVDTPSYQAHPEYYLNYPMGNSRILNLGKEEAYQWAYDMLSEKIETYHLDVMRIDYNVGAIESWDDFDEENRHGIAQIRATENFYRLWSELRRRFPHLLIDNCASGGRRLDFEANTNSVSLFRTDFLCYADHTPEGLQVQTGGLAPFVPLAGLQHTLESNWYNFLSSLAAGMGISPDMVEKAMKDEAEMERLRRQLAVFKRVQPMYVGDFYLFTSVTLSEKDWFAYQMNRPEDGTACVLSARRPKCPMSAATYQLHGLEAGALYELEDAQTGAVLGHMSGEALMTEGLTVKLDTPAQASLVFVTKVNA